MNAIINYLDKYHGQLTVLLLGLSLIILAVFLWVWFYNRRKYNHLKHQIPASVVKNYLDSIIQNSTSLKSSLFRGGGLDVDANGVPSVMPLSDLAGGGQVNVSGGGDDSALRAEIARLQALLNEKTVVVKDLENKNVELGGDVKAKQARIEELEKMLSEKGGDPAAAGQVAELKEERDKLQEELKQYDLISDDIADLKRLRQENAQLKKALEDSGAPAPESEAVVEEAPVEEEPIADEPIEEAPVEEPVEEEPVAEEAAPEEPAEEEPIGEPAAEEPVAQEATSDSGEDDDSKSPEDLLSEFEKMLG